jgi:hypothetical protein
MNRPIRIGLIAEGEAELGSSVPYLKPEEGGKIIDRNQEGALHTLIRRKLTSSGLPDCDFVHRHPSIREMGKKTFRTGHSILDRKYLSQLVIAWKPTEVDLILILADADNILAERQKAVADALETIRANHLDLNDRSIQNQSVGGLAIKNFETWLLADIQTVAKILAVDIKQLENLEELDETKNILESAIAQSTYFSEDSSNQRPLRIRWDLANRVNLDTIETCCPNGCGAFMKSLIVAARVSVDTYV